MQNLERRISELESKVVDNRQTKIMLVAPMTGETSADARMRLSIAPDVKVVMLVPLKRAH